MAKKPKKKAAPAPKKNVAILDKAGILTGYKEVSEGAEGVEVPDKDLEIGRYQWDGETFLPIAKKDPKKDMNAGALRAIYLGLDAIRAAGVVDLPAETVAWLEWYSTTNDAKGAS